MQQVGQHKSVYHVPKACVCGFQYLRWQPHKLRWHNADSCRGQNLEVHDNNLLHAPPGFNPSYDNIRFLSPSHGKKSFQNNKTITCSGKQKYRNVLHMPKTYPTSWCQEVFFHVQEVASCTYKSKFEISKKSTGRDQILAVSGLL